MNIEQTIDFVMKAHAGQTDKAGNPYIDHLMRVRQYSLDIVAEYDISLTEDEIFELEQVALMHDVLEDTDFNASQLIDMGFSEKVVKRVQRLDRSLNPKQTYQDYIYNIAKYEDLETIIVKLADNRDNSSRLHDLDDTKAKSLGKRYEKARVTLIEGILGAISERKIIKEYDISEWAQEKFKVVLRSEFAVSFIERILDWDIKYKKLRQAEKDGVNFKLANQDMSGANDSKKFMARRVRNLELLVAANHTCYICGEKIDMDDEKSWDQDHVFPVAHLRKMGYKNFTTGNLMIAHKACNHSKESRLPTDEEIRFAQETYNKVGKSFFRLEKKNENN